MFRAVRREKLVLPEDVCLDILRNGSYGTLALLGDDDYPYAVPVNYVFDGSAIWVHCALEGHKIDAIRRHAKVSFSVVESDTVSPEDLSTNYRSVLAFGKACLVTDAEQKLTALRALCQKYAPDVSMDVEAYIAKTQPKTGVIKVTVEHISGKEGKNLAMARKKAQDLAGSADKQPTD